MLIVKFSVAMLAAIFLRLIILSTTSVHSTDAFVVPQSSHLLRSINSNIDIDDNNDDTKFKNQRLAKKSSFQRIPQAQHQLISVISTRRWSLLDDAANAMDAMDDTTKQAAIAVAGGGGLVTFVGSVIASQFSKDGNRETTYDSNDISTTSSSYAVSKWTPYTSVKTVPGSSSSNYLSKMSQPSSVRKSNGFTSFVARMKDLMNGIQSSREQQQQRPDVANSQDRNISDNYQKPKRDIPFFQNKPTASAAADDKSNNVSGSPLIGNTQLRERLDDEKNRVTGSEDRVKQMWMNRERLQVVKDPLPQPPPPVQPPSSASSSMDYMKGIGSTSAYTKSSYSMTKWSPSQGVPSSSFSRNDDNYYNSNAYEVSSTDTVGNAGRGSASYGTVTPSSRKSYAMTRWNPYTKVSTAMGSTGSYLANMASAYSMPSSPNTASLSPSMNNVAPPAKPPVTVADQTVINTATYDYSSRSEAAAISSADGNTQQAISYSSATTTSSTGSWTPNGAVVVQSNNSNVGSDVKKSYSVSKWTPNSQVSSTLPASSSASAYLSNMQTGTTTPQNSYSSIQPTYAVPPSTLYDMRGSTTSTTSEMPLPPPLPSVAFPSYNAPAPSPYTDRSSSLPAAISNMDYLGMLSGVQVTKSKKSYAMTTWSPGNRVNNAVSNPYLTNMNYASATRPAPLSYPSMTPPPVPPQPAPPSELQQQSYAGYGSATIAEAAPSSPTSGNTYDQMYRQYSMTTSSGMPPNAGISTSTTKSYSMTNWSPKSEVKDATTGSSSASYLSNVSTGNNPQSTSYSYGTSSIATSSDPPVTSVSATASPVSEGSIAKIDSIKTTKSYSMTSWSPKSTINTAATTGSSTASSYLSNMSNGSSLSSQKTAGTSSVTQPSASPPASPAPTWGGTIPGRDNSGAKETSKKSYATTNWSPKSVVSSSVRPSGSSESYLSSMSSGMISTTVSPSLPNGLRTSTWTAPAVAPAPAWNGEIPTDSNSRSSETKTSYSMTSWSPKSGVNPIATGSSASYLSSMSNGATPTSLHTGKADVKKSYSTTKWSPKSQAATATTVSSQSFLSDVASGLSYERSSQESTSYGSTLPYSSPADPKKSYSMTSWSPNTPTTDAMSGSTASYLSNMSIGQTLSTSSLPIPSSPSNSYSSVIPAPSPSWTGSIPSGINFKASEAKKSYSMTNWSPKTKTSNSIEGHSTSYLTNMSNHGASTSLSSSAATSVSPSASSVGYRPSWENDTPKIGNTSASIPKKSYSMTSWSPKSKMNVATTGGSATYLSNMSNKPISSPLAQPLSYITPTAAATQLETSTVSSSNIGISSFSSTGDAESSQSYSTNNWSPNSQKGVSNEAVQERPSSPLFGTLGSGSSYLSNISNPTTSSHVSYQFESSLVPPPAPAPAPFWSSALPSDDSTNFLPKKSYSMTSWTPGSSLSAGWVDSMGQNGAYWGSMESGAKIRDRSMTHDSSGFVTALGGRSTTDYNGMMESAVIPNREKPHYFSEKSDEVGEHSASFNIERNEDPPMSPQYTRLILQSDPVSPPYTDSIHAVVGGPKTSYGPTKWSPEKGVPRRIL